MNFSGFRAQILVEFSALIQDLSFIAGMINAGKCDTEWG